MSLPHLFSFGLEGLVSAAFSQPVFSLLVAFVVTGGILIASGSRGRPRRAAMLSGSDLASVRAKYLPEQRLLGAAAIVIIVLFLGEYLIRGYVLDLSGSVSWWRHATPMFCAIVSIALVAGMILLRGAKPSEAVVVPMTRRTWLSFGPQAGVAAAAIVMLALLGTTIAAGLASTPDDQGRFTMLDLPVPNEPTMDPLRLPFYGWAYGVPVLVCLCALAVATGALLKGNAARPFLRPETVAAERLVRRGVAQGAVSIALAAMLLALAGAWRMIAWAGSVSGVQIVGQNGGAPYEVIWRYSELAAAAGWLAPVLEIAAFVLLLLLASSLRRLCQARASASDVERGAEVLR